MPDLEASDIRKATSSIFRAYREMGEMPEKFCRALEDAQDYQVRRLNEATEEEDWEEVRTRGRMLDVIRALESTCP